MALLLRHRELGLIQRCVVNKLLRNRNISTTKKNSDTAAAATTAEVPTCSASKKDDNWISYGFSEKDKEEDTNAHNASFFFSVTLCIVFGGFIWTYGPDHNLRDWASREAFLELRRREQAGEPLISPNYLDPKNIVLPDDSELGETEIVI